MGEPDRVLILPGWLGSGDRHWQTRWEARYGDERVVQADWERPLRGDWLARLEDVLLADPRPALLVAHSLGCHLATAWATTTRQPQRVRGALLVAPPDTERPDLPPQLHSWRARTVRTPLPFRATLLYSDDDPYCSAERARHMAADWHATAHTVGALGHVNADSGLGDWPPGRAWLDALR